MNKPHEATALFEEFAVVVYENLEKKEVVQAATSQLTRVLRFDFLAFFVASPSGRHLELQQLAGQSRSKVDVDEIRPMVEVNADPLSSHHTKIWAIDECEILKEKSPIADALTQSNLESVIVQTLCKDGEILAQVWIGFRDLNGVSTDDIEFVSRAGQHLPPALENARSAESL
ncbi:MAG TPA: hypothetical protein EYQ61_07740 [Dehalococcoidia bacterium]|nr:hypothetical protein [Dehalococcoidia bacterium]HIK90191.1 hypothetical protein [Dehalococcoidia bacterium]